MEREGQAVTEYELETKSLPPDDEVISKPNWTLPMVTLPNQPLLRSQVAIALMSTEPDEVLPVRTNENTWLDPFEPR